MLREETYVFCEDECSLRYPHTQTPRRSPESLRPELAALLSRLHVLVIGPGLGREEHMQTFARVALEAAKEQGMFLVLDADALYMVGRQLDLIKGYRRAVLTPNVVEFKRLSEQVVRVASYVTYYSESCELIPLVRALIPTLRRGNARRWCRKHLAVWPCFRRANQISSRSTRKASKVRS